MPDFCAALGCSNQRNANTKQQGITFHRSQKREFFWVCPLGNDLQPISVKDPLFLSQTHHFHMVKGKTAFPKDKVKRQLWKMALKRRDFEPNDRSVVCSFHFKAEDFDRTGQTTRIREGVVPSVFLFTRHLGKAPTATRTSRTSQRAAEEPPQVQFQVTVEPTASDHQYALDPVQVKKRLNEAREKLEELRRDLRNAKDRERRHKKTVQSLLEDLKHKHMLSEELQQRLDDILLG